MAIDEKGRRTSISNIIPTAFAVFETFPSKKWGQGQLKTVGKDFPMPFRAEAGRVMTHYLA